MSFQYRELHEFIVKHFKADVSGIHGLQHWKQVEKFGATLAKHNGADFDVIRLFALLHDAERVSEDFDNEHGSRGASLALKLRGTLYDLDDYRFNLLYTACKYHSDGECTDNVTIGSCWDADRLDLTRLSIYPDTKYISTTYGTQLAEYLIKL